jgi:hypothetical protein
MPRGPCTALAIMSPARHAAADEGGDLPLEYLALQLAQDLLGLAERQAQLLDALVLLGQVDQVLDDFLAILGDHHHLHSDLQGHSAVLPLKGSAYGTQSQVTRQRPGAPSLLCAPPQPGEYPAEWFVTNHSVVL